MKDRNRLKQSLGCATRDDIDGQSAALRRQATAMAELLLEIYMAKHRVRRRRRRPQLSTLTDEKTDRTLKEKPT